MQCVTILKFLALWYLHKKNSSKSVGLFTLYDKRNKNHQNPLVCLLFMIDILLLFLWFS